MPLKLTPAQSQETTNMKTQQYPWLLRSEQSTSYPTPPVLKSKTKDLSLSKTPKPEENHLKTLSQAISIKTHVFQSKYINEFQDEELN